MDSLETKLQREWHEVCEKRYKLNQFMETYDYEQLSTQSRALLDIQSAILLAYIEVLEARIRLLSEK